MKEKILAALLALVSVSGFAQDFDVDPSLNISNNEKKVKFTVGARFVADGALYSTDFTSLNSGAAIADARIRTSMKYGENWYFYADFGFGGGKFSQKNIFLEYSEKSAKGATHAVKLGYYSDPAGTMARQTSLGGYHFISRPGSADALGAGRELGVSYKYSAPSVYLYQGVFTENQYNKAVTSYTGSAIAGRWLYRSIGKHGGGHFGASARFGHIGGGEDYTAGGVTVQRKRLSLAQTMETYVDDDKSIVSCDLPWANNVIDLGVEAFGFGANYFVRAEYQYKIVTKKRDSDKLFSAAQDGGEGWDSYDTWLSAHPLRTNHFSGAYVEAGYKIFGADYKYDMNDAVLGGLSGKSLEVVGRVNYTNLNDKAPAEHYSADLGQYVPEGSVGCEKEYEAASVGGGRVISATVGVNFAFNKYAQIMLDYTYANLKKDALPLDRHFHQVQTRVQFSF